MFIKILQNSRPATFSKRHRCFPENLQIFLRTPFFEDLNGVAEWCDWLFRLFRLNGAVANNSYTARIHQQTFWIDSTKKKGRTIRVKVCHNFIHNALLTVSICIFCCIFLMKYPVHRARNYIRNWLISLIFTRIPNNLIKFLCLHI